MKLLNLKVFTAIQGGDLKALKEILEIATGKQFSSLNKKSGRFHRG